MDHAQILKKAWKILWSYKILWVFGILIAFAGGSGGTSQFQFPSFSSNNLDSSDFQRIWPDLERDFGNLFEETEVAELWEGIAAIVIAVICVLVLISLIFALIFAVIRYVSQTALIRMVDRYDAQGEKLGFLAGLRLGWSRGAWRLFLINLVIRLPITIVLIGLFGAALLPAVIAGVASAEPIVLWIVVSVALFMLAALFALVVNVALSLVMEVIWRDCVLQDLGVFASIRAGFRRVRAHFVEVFLLWLILLGVQIGLFFLFGILIFFLLLAGITIGGATAIVLFLLLKGAAEVAALVGSILLGFFILIVCITLPSLFLSGLKEVYISSSWTLGYRSIARPAPAELPPDSGEIPQPA